MYLQLSCNIPATRKYVDFAVIRLLQGVLKIPCLSFGERLHVDYSDFDRDSKTAVGINGLGTSRMLLQQTKWDIASKFCG